MSSMLTTLADMLHACITTIRRWIGGFFCAAFFLCGCFFAYSDAPHRIALGVFFGSGFLLLLLTGCLIKKRRATANGSPAVVVAAVLCMAVFLSCLHSYVLFDVLPARFSARTGAVHSITGTVEEAVYTTSYAGTYIVLVREDGLPYKIVIETNHPDWHPGQVIRGTVLFRSFREGDAFSERQYYYGKAVLAAAEEISLENTGAYRRSPRILLADWNRSLSAKILAHVPEGGMATAMALGNRDALSDAVQRDFRRIGIYPLLAVSGTHLALLTNFAEQRMRRHFLRPKIRNRVLTVLILLYMALTGFSASILRAGIMHLLLLLARRLDVQANRFSVLHIACFCIVLLQPYAVMDMGLHLSYLSVCGCLLAARLEAQSGCFRYLRKQIWEALRQKRKWRGALLSLLKTAVSSLVCTLSVTILLLPLSWLYFGEMSLLSGAANLLYIPLTGILLALTFLYLFLFPIRIAILPLVAVMTGVIRAAAQSAAFLSRLSFSTVSLHYPFVPPLIFLLLLLFAATVFARRKKWYIAGTACVFFVLLLSIGGMRLYQKNIDDAVYCNLAKNDGFLLRSCGEALLVDISDGSYTYTQSLLAEAKNRNFTELGGYLVTHYHNRHIATFQKLSDRWIVRRLYLPLPQNDKEKGIYDALAACASEKDIEVLSFQPETVFGNLQIRTGARVYLSRSTHPVTTIAFATEDMLAVYGSASLAEGDPSQLRLAEYADIVICGAHSPKAKKHLSLPETKSIHGRERCILTAGDGSLAVESPAAIAAGDGLYSFSLTPEADTTQVQPVRE